MDTVSSQSLRTVAGALLFLATFTVPLYLGISWLRHSRTGRAAVEAAQIFPSAFLVKGDRSLLRVNHSTDLNPIPGKDFLLVSWFLPDRLPRNGDRITLMSKFDGETGEGYALALAEGGGAHHFMVYWRNSQMAGRWFSFADQPVVAGAWIMTAISLHEGRYLGFHSATLIPGKRPDLVLGGGYDLGERVSLPSPSADLIIGAAKSGQFKGLIGPIAVLQGAKISENFKDVLKSLARDPVDVPSALPKDNVKLWSVDLEQDESEFHHIIHSEGLSRLEPQGGD